MMALMVRWRLSQSWLAQDGEQQRCGNGSAYHGASSDLGVG
jgi:hypothetical protein